MNTQLTRRHFLVQTGCMVGGAVAAAPMSRSAFAVEKRPAWLATCRDAIIRPAGHKDIWSALKTVRAEGVEVAVAGDLTLPSLFHPTKKYTLATAAGINQFAADAKAAGMRITGFCMSNDFEQQHAAELARCTRLAGIAQSLGVPMIRIDVVPRKLSKPDLLKVAVAVLQRIIAATESTDVPFGVENHSNTTNDPSFLNALFDGVGSKRLGLNLDIGNFYWFGHPLSKIYELAEEFAPRVFHTHCKNIRYPAGEREKQRPMGWKYGEYACPIDEGDIDYSRIVAILTKVGYHNDFCIEDESLGKFGDGATKTLAREIQFLKQLRAKTPVT